MSFQFWFVKPHSVPWAVSAVGDCKSRMWWMIFVLSMTGVIAVTCVASAGFSSSPKHTYLSLSFDGISYGVAGVSVTSGTQSRGSPPPVPPPPVPPQVSVDSGMPACT